MCGIFDTLNIHELGIKKIIIGIPQIIANTQKELGILLETMADKTGDYNIIKGRYMYDQNILYKHPKYEENERIEISKEAIKEIKHGQISLKIMTLIQTLEQILMLNGHYALGIKITITKLQSNQ